MAKGKSINLTPRAPKPKKEEDKYKETSKPKPFKYAHNVGDNIIYKGIIEEYYNTLATITKRSHKNQNEYYTIKFSLDDVEKKDIGGGILQSLEEYEAELASGTNEEKKDMNEQDDDINDLSDIELEVINNGYKSMGNKTTCMNPLLFYERRCEQCYNFKNECVYRCKGKYDKIKF